MAASFSLGIPGENHGGANRASYTYTLYRPVADHYRLRTNVYAGKFELVFTLLLVLCSYILNFIIHNNYKCTGYFKLAGPNIK